MMCTEGGKERRGEGKKRRQGGKNLWETAEGRRRLPSHRGEGGERRGERRPQSTCTFFWLHLALKPESVAPSLRPCRHLFFTHPHFPTLLNERYPLNTCRCWLIGVATRKIVEHSMNKRLFASCMH